MVFGRNFGEAVKTAGEEPRPSDERARTEGSIAIVEMVEHSIKELCNVEWATREKWKHAGNRSFWCTG